MNWKWFVLFIGLSTVGAIINTTLVFGLLFIAQGCTETTAQEAKDARARELKLIVCEGEADAYKILRGKRECLDKGVPFAGCDKEQEIKDEHRKALIECQE